jgi:hypothetical protein
MAMDMETEAAVTTGMAEAAVTTGMAEVAEMETMVMEVAEMAQTGR